MQMARPWVPVKCFSGADGIKEQLRVCHGGLACAYPWPWQTPAPVGLSAPLPLCLHLLWVQDLRPSLPCVASTFQPLLFSNEATTKASPSPGPRQLCGSQDQTRTPLQGHGDPPPHCRWPHAAHSTQPCTLRGPFPPGTLQAAPNSPRLPLIQFSKSRP